WPTAVPECASRLRASARPPCERCSSRTRAACVGPSPAQDSDQPTAELPARSDSSFGRDGRGIRTAMASTRRPLSARAAQPLRYHSPVIAALSGAPRFGPMIGESEEMRALYPLCALLAASDVPIVIEGETGTGKEVLAQAIHEASPRAPGPFVVFDCTAVPPT